MEHCFDTGPILQVSSLYQEENLCIIDPLSELIAYITKQLIQYTSGSFVDIGAFRGKWADYVHNNCPDIARRIYVYDPSPTSHSILTQKYRKTPRIQVHNLALSSERGLMKFIDDEQSSKVYNEIDDSYMGHRIIQVPSIKYDAIFKEKEIGIVKIRTNGHELNVLAGMHEAIENKKVGSIIFECNPIIYGFVDDEYVINKYLRSLKSNYKYLYIIEREILETNRIETQKELDRFLSALNLFDLYDIVCCDVLLLAPKN